MNLFSFNSIHRKRNNACLKIDLMISRCIFKFQVFKKGHCSTFIMILRHDNTRAHRPSKSKTIYKGKFYHNYLIHQTLHHAITTFTISYTATYQNSNFRLKIRCEKKIDELIPCFKRPILYCHPFEFWKSVVEANSYYIDWNLYFI